MTDERARIVLFGHSGREHLVNYTRYAEGKDYHLYDLNKALDEKYMPWNDGEHFRKFMKAYGKYVTYWGKEPEPGYITFWGEWEPGTSFNKIRYSSTDPGDDMISKIRNSNLPKYLHHVDEQKKETGKFLQNTDPCVFGESFYYTNCKEYKAGMKKLNQGDIILFGTPGRGGINTGCKYMELDTVFVVREKMTITKRKDYPAFSEFNNPKYNYFKNAVLEKIFERIDKKTGNFYVTDDSEEFVIYEGATYDHPANGTYSFVPCKKYDEDLERCSFGKVILTEQEFGQILNVKLTPVNTPTSNNNINGEKIPSLDCFKNYIHSDEDDKTLMKKFWDVIAQTVLNQGCYLGVHIKQPDLIE